MKRAIFIIANNYRGNRSLRELNVGRDMVGLGGFFEHVAGYDIVEIVQDVPCDVVLAKLDALLQRLEPGDLLVIYFGGHGVQSVEHLLVLPPSEQDPPGTPFGFLAVAELLRRTDYHGLSRGVILDCCRNNDANAAPVTGAAAEYSRRVRMSPDAARSIGLAEAATPKPGAARGSYAIFRACTEDEVAPEVGDSGKGLFSTALLRVLRRASEAGRPVQLDDVLRAAVEAEMHAIAEAEHQDIRPQPCKDGNGTPEVLAAAAGPTAFRTRRAEEAEPTKPPPAPEKIITNSIGMKLVRIEPGTFLMGSPPSEQERSNDELQHKVTLTRPFYMAATAVSQKQWKAVMGQGDNPSHFRGDDLPVEQVSWHDAVEFCQKLSQTEGKQYRLPTEAEWEYCCRAGTTTAFNTGGTISTDQANYNGKEKAYGRGRTGEYRGKTIAVEQFSPNAWGLYQMHGNVWEWCHDVYGPYGAGEERDPDGPRSQEANASRVLRGGSWGRYPRSCRSAYRRGLAPGIRINFIGFRVVLDSP